ncbi:MAG: NUDIX hydrolase [Deltaproteobacteria bacterium]|nr:NUDIX hydrolase [Deltaproteobacteria bacterium]
MPLFLRKRRLNPQQPKGPLLTVDAIIEKDGTVLLVSRKNPPLGWALPGGFVDYGESVENALRREVKEETSLCTTSHTLFGVYSDPSRDPRFHTVSIIYIAKVEGVPKARSDAREAKFFSINNLPELCFDHKRILNDYLTKYKFTKEH